MQSGLASPALTDLAIVHRKTTCDIRQDITSAAYWAGACASAAAWLLFILYAIGRSLG